MGQRVSADRQSPLCLLQLCAQLVALGLSESKAYLCDDGVDRENTLDGGVKETDTFYWTHMYDSACMAAGQRAEELGYSINELIGRVIY